MECVHFFFSHCFCFTSRLNSKNCFSHSTALDCVLFGVLYKIRVLLLQNRPAPLREQKNKIKKRWKATESPEGFFFFFSEWDPA